MISDEEIIAILRRHGDCKPQNIADWNGSIPLPEEIAEYYGRIGPPGIEIREYGNPFYLPSLRELWDLQAGYRYHHQTNELFDEWNGAWLVVGDDGGDAFIFNRDDGKIYYALHGMGYWKPEEMFSTIYEMAACLGIMGSIVLEAGEKFTDEESYIVYEWKDKCRQELSRVLGSYEASERLMKSLGW